VTDITRSVSQEAYLVETDTEMIEAHRVVLAVGLSATPTLPEWTTSLSDDVPLAHVWDDEFDPTTTSEFEGRTFVVEGGITAGQLACHLAERTDVTLLSRHELDIELTEADPYWINWRHIGKEIHTLPPGSEARLDRIRAARNDATIPPYVERRLTEACDDGTLELRQGEITPAHATDQGLFLRFDDGTRATGARVVLATGLEPVPEQPLVERVSESLSLARGAGGGSRPRQPNAHVETDRLHRVRGVRFGRAHGAQRRSVRSEHRRCSTRRGTNLRYTYSPRHQR